MKPFPPAGTGECPECRAGRGKHNKAEAAALPGAAQSKHKLRVPPRQRLRFSVWNPSDTWWLQGHAVGGFSQRCCLLLLINSPN